MVGERSSNGDGTKRAVVTVLHTVLTVESTAEVSLSLSLYYLTTISHSISSRMITSRTCFAYYPIALFVLLLSNSHSTPTLRHINALSISAPHHSTSPHSTSSFSQQQHDPSSLHDTTSIVHHLMSPFTDIWKLISTDDGAAPTRLSTSAMSNFQTGKEEKKENQQQQKQQQQHQSTRFDATLDNNAPSNVPPARLFIPLIPLGDGSHYAVTIYVGGSSASSNSSSNSTSLQPDSNSRPMLFILDSGSSDMIIYNRTHCYGNGTSPCYISSPSTLKLNQTRPLEGYHQFWITLDDESFRSDPSALQLTQDLFTLQVNVGGGENDSTTTTNQATTYRMNQVQFFVQTNETLMYITQPRYSYSATLQNADYYYAVAGILGLGPAFTSIVSYASYPSYTTGFESLINETTPILGFNFAKNELALDGLDAEWIPRLAWNDYGIVTELLDSGIPQYSYTFYMYHLTLCGVDLFSNLTTHWHVVVDTGSSCLGLPAEFFDSILAWLPLKCNLGKDDMLPHVCYVTTQDTVPILPTISFQLTDNGPPLYISLTDLLFPLGSLSNRLCITRTGSILQTVRGPANMITIGSRVLKQFYLGVLPGEQRVGFANIQRNLTTSTVQCAPRVVCSGMQVHYEQLNMCLPPPCEDFFFFELDSAGTSCVLQSSFHITAGLLIAIFILAELGLNEMVIYLGKKVRQNALAAGGAAPMAAN